MKVIQGVRAAGIALAPALVLCAIGCRSGDAPASAAVATLTLAADSASHPTVAVDPRAGTAYFAWVGVRDGRNAVLLTALEVGAEVPREPVRVNDVPGDAVPHAQAPAQVAVGPEGNVYVLWQNNTPVEGRRFPASDLRMAVSTDGGRTFAPAITVNDDAGGPPTSHTFHDLAVAADGTVLVSWIDSRTRESADHPGALSGSTAAQMHVHYATAAPMPMRQTGASSAHDVGDPMPADHQHEREVPVGPEIRVARSLDGGATFNGSMVVDSAACPCCRTSLVLGRDGAVYVAWRKIFPGDVRDVVVARAEPGSLRFGAPVRVHRDEWVFPGCPHAGPSLAVDGAGNLLVGWYTGKEGRQGLWYATSADGGQTFGDPSPMLTADFVPPSQLRLAVAGERVWAAWDDRTTTDPRIRLAVGPVGGALRPIEDAASPGGDPEIASTGAGALVAWLEGESVRARWLHE